MPEGIVFKFTKHTKRQRFFSVLFRYFEISGDCQGIYHNKKNANSPIYRLLALLSVLGAGLEPAQPQWSQDFKSCVSTIPPSERTGKQIKKLQLLEEILRAKVIFIFEKIKNLFV